MEAPAALRKYIREYVRTVYDRKVDDMKIDYHWRHPSDIEHPLQPGWYEKGPGKLSTMPGMEDDTKSKYINNESLRNWFK